MTTRDTVSLVCTILLICMLFASCTKELDRTSEMKPCLNFKTNRMELIQTKSTGEVKTKIKESRLVSEDGSFSIPVLVSVSERCGAAQTKTGITESVDQFYVRGFRRSSRWFPSGTSPKLVTTETEYDEYQWKSGWNLDFYAYSNLPDEGMSASITYNGVSLNVSKLSEDLGDFADVVLGRYSGTGNGTGTAEMEFFHPFAGVLWEPGNLPAIRNLYGLSIEGIYTAGKTVLTASTPVSVEGSNKVAVFVWTDLKTGSLQLNPLSQPFMFIPQDFSEKKAWLKIRVERTSGKIENLYLMLDGKWESGKLYYYTISCTLPRPNVDWTATNDSLTIYMNDSLNMEECSYEYELFEKDSDTPIESRSTTSETSVTFEGLQSGTAYTIKVGSVLNDDTEGKYSSPIATVEAETF